MQAAALVLSPQPPSPACACILGCHRVWDGIPDARLPALCSLPALPAPSWQELQAVLCQQLPGGKDPSGFSSLALGCIQNALGMHWDHGRGWQKGSAS